MVTHFSGKRQEFSSISIVKQRDQEKISSESEESEDSQEEKDQDKLFYSWECLSLVRNDGSTLDLVIKN